MIVPKFRLTQDDEFVYIHIRVPYIRVSDLEYVIDQTDISFYVKPYLLKLTLPNKVVDNEKTKAIYDAEKDNGTVVLHLPKEETGLEFKDLDLLTKLQQPSRSKSTLPIFSPTNDSVKKTESNDKAGKPLIEVLSSIEFDNNKYMQTNETGDEKSVNNKEEEKSKKSSNESTEDLLSRLLDEKVNIGAEIENNSVDIQITKPKYGFNNNMDSFFHDIESEFPELVDLPKPDETSMGERRQLRIEHEDKSFDKDRYLGDYYGADEDPLFIEMVKFEPFWRIKPMIKDEQQQNNSSFEFTEEEQKQLMNLKNKEYLVFSPEETERCLNSILDVVFAYTYDCRLTQGESNVESAWTIRILSSTLSWLDSFTQPEETLLANFHRILVYPYLRHYALGKFLLEDVLCIIENYGKRGILRCLLAIHKIFSKSDLYYLLNRLYITDMCIWLQQLDQTTLDNYFEKTKVTIQNILNSDPPLRFDLTI